MSRLVRRRLSKLIILFALWCAVREVRDMHVGTIIRFQQKCVCNTDVGLAIFFQKMKTRSTRKEKIIGSVVATMKTENVFLKEKKKKHLPVCRGGYTHTYTPKHAPEQSIRFRKREYWLPILSPKFTTPRLEGAQKKRRNLTTSQGSSLRDRVAPPSGPPYNWPIWNFRRFSVRRKK